MQTSPFTRSSVQSSPRAEGVAEAKRRSRTPALVALGQTDRELDRPVNLPLALPAPMSLPSCHDSPFLHGAVFADAVVVLEPETMGSIKT